MTTPAVRSAAFGIAVIGTAISAYLVWVHYSGALFALYLTYLELFVIHAVCPWCVAVDSAVVALFLLTVVELRGAP